MDGSLDLLAFFYTGIKLADVFHQLVVAKLVLPHVVGRVGNLHVQRSLRVFGVEVVAPVVTARTQ